jgi:arabinogalactan oligomer / maltooligosaccharide transport system permease protein
VIGHYGDKASSIAILGSEEQQVEGAAPGVTAKFDTVLGYLDGDKANLAVLATDTWGDSQYAYFLATPTTFTPLTEADVKLEEVNYTAIATKGFTRFSKAELSAMIETIPGLKFKYETRYFLKLGAPIKGFFEGSVNQSMSVYTYFISTKDKYRIVPAADVVKDGSGMAIKAKNFTKFTSSQIAKYSEQIGKIHLAYKKPAPYFIGIETLPSPGTSFAYSIVQIKNIQYDKKADTFTNVLTGAVYKDDGKGNFRNIKQTKDYLDPGWRQGVWFENFTSLFSDQRIRDPLIKVFIWTIAFAFLTVITQFALGLLVALAMDKKIRGRGIYRSLMILPYAMPSIMSILIWGGMLDDNGAINSLLNINVQWLHDPWMAKVSVLLVNLWLGFPYFYLIAAGSLQAIPKELAESAGIDGANPRQIFRLITLPLLLRMLTPLLIASFAFNFNNFNIIYLLTGGGPSFEFGSVAGATDILISYTYKLAFDTTIQNYGLASAISVVIFIIVAGMSMYGIRKSKVLDDFA